MVAYAVLAERKVSAFIQDRVGPEPRSGSHSVCSNLAADRGRVKSFLKEDFTPAHVRKGLFLAGAGDRDDPGLLTVASFRLARNLGEQKMVIADLNVGILYTFGIVSLGVYGIVLAGYASNSKYPFLGGIRSSAQMISYEIAMGMSVVPVFLIVGELNLSEVIDYQAGSMCWLIFKRPRLYHLPGRGVCGNQSAAVRFAGIGAGTGRRL